MTKLEKRIESGDFFRTDDPGERGYHKQPRISITETEAKILASYCLGRGVIEIGTGTGTSTTALASTADFVWTHDIDAWVQSTIFPELEAAHSNVVYTFATREAIVATCDELRLGAQPFDVAFIDADHDTEAVRRDIQFVRGLLEPYSLIICHDAGYDNVRLALCAEFGDDWVLIATHHGLGVHIHK